jgi:crossover junction endodeoxyribonuclease RusA
MFELVLPWPPSVNHYKKVGAIIKTSSGKIYQKRVNTNETKMFYWQAYQECKKRMPPEGSIFCRDSTIRLGVNIGLHPPHSKRYDLDNRLKVLLDSLTRARVWNDDSQICRLFVQKLEPKEKGEVVIQIYSLESV